MSCWDKHPRTGIVANADPRGPVPYDHSRAYHARACCDRPRCIAAAKGQVRISTGEPGIYFPDPTTRQRDDARDLAVRSGIFETDTP